MDMRYDRRQSVWKTGQINTIRENNYSTGLDVDYIESLPGCARCAILEERRQLGLGASVRGYENNLPWTTDTETTQENVNDEISRDSHKVICNILAYPLKLLCIIGFPISVIESHSAQDMQLDGSLASISRRFSQGEVLSTMMWILNFVIHVISIVRCVAFIDYVLETYEIGLAFNHIHFAVFTLRGSFVFFSENLSAPKRAIQLFTALRVHIDKHGLSTDITKFAYKVRLWTCALVTTFTTLIGSWVIFHQVVNTKQGVFYVYPWNVYEGTRVQLYSCAVATAMLITTLPLIAGYALYSALVALLINEFKVTSEILKMEVDANDGKSEGMLEDTFIDIRERHRSLAHVVSCLNEQCGLFCGVVLVFDHLLFMCVVYALARGPIVSEELLSEHTSLAFALFSIVLVCCYWGKLNSAAQSIINPLRFSSWLGKSTSWLQKVQLFISDVSCSNIGVSFFGVCAIDTSTIIVTLGSLLSYGIMIVEIERNARAERKCQILQDSYNSEMNASAHH